MQQLRRHWTGRLALAGSFVLACAGFTAKEAGAQEIQLSPEQALREIFPEARRTSVQTRELSASAVQKLSKRLGRKISPEPREVTLVWDGSGRLAGYAVVTEETGKYRPITFMVGVTPQLAVRDVAVLAYRESRGGDIRRKRFLSQYRGKTSSNAIDSNQDIINISGATISVRSMNAGVRRVLAELEVLYGTARQ